MSRIALGGMVEMSASAALEVYARAEELGYESIWLPETRFTRDAITTAVSAGLTTSRMGIGTGVVNVYTRGPVLTAISFAVLDELTGGRAIAGIGPGSPAVLAAQGISFDRPLVRLRETVEVMRRLWRGEHVTFEGESITVRDAHLDFQPIREHIPVYLGVTGPRALKLAGEIADGVLLNSFVSPEYVRAAVAHIAAGAACAGRSPDQIDVAGCVEVSMHADPLCARDAVRPSLATYLAAFPHIALQSSFAEEDIESIRRAYRVGGAEMAAPLVTDAMVEKLAVAGTREECMQRIAEYREAGLQLPVLDVIGPNPIETIEALVSE